VSVAPARDWTIYANGTIVHVPLQPYLVSAADPSSVLAYAVGLGAEFVAQLNQPIRRLFVAVGESPTVSGDEPVLRFWLGLAARLE
jgi:hypothetical protein